jgi:peptide/nickel transport system permease protein
MTCRHDLWRPVAAVLTALIPALGTVLGLILVVFLIARILPNDPVTAIVGADAPQAVYDRVHHQLGLDRPLWQQFLTLMSGIVTLDFGNSFLTGHKVLDDIGNVLPATIELSVTAVLLGGPIGLLAGLVAASWQGRWVDTAIRFVGLTLYSTPSFLTALLALMIFYYALGWTDGPGRLAAFNVGAIPERTGLILIDALLAGDGEIFRDGLGHLVLPLSVLTLVNAAWFSRFCRTFALEELGREYVLVARIKGVRQRGVVWNHVLRNMMVQLLTISAVALASSLEGSVLVETIFAWPGFGQYFVQTLLKGDLNAVVGCTFLTGVFFVASNMVTENLFRVVDARTRP